MTHFLLSYTVAGIWTMFVITSVDLATPKKPSMGVGWTLVAGVAWPVFMTVVMVALLKQLRERD
jgi:hypothetical protein